MCNGSDNWTQLPEELRRRVVVMARNIADGMTDEQDYQTFLEYSALVLDFSDPLDVQELIEADPTFYECTLEGAWQD